MAISFTLPEGELPPVLSRFRRGEELAVQAWDRGERMLFGEGVLESLDNQIDTTTGTLKLKARFDNEAELLIPNQFVNVRLRVETLQDATLIPSEALQFGSRGHFAYVVGEDNKVQLRILEAHSGPCGVGRGRTGGAGGYRPPARRCRGGSGRPAQAG
jgi:multidrug efflux system membrane fusion protein